MSRVFWDNFDIMKLTVMYDQQLLLINTVNTLRDEMEFYRSSFSIYLSNPILLKKQNFHWYVNILRSPKRL